MTKQVRTMCPRLFDAHRSADRSPQTYRPADADRSPGIRAARRWSAWWLLVAMIATLPGCSRDTGGKDESGQAKAVPVTVAAVEFRPVETTIDVVGSLKGWEDIKIGTKKTGRVIKTLHDVGDRVKPGELLVQLETVNVDLAIQQAEKRLLTELAKLGLTKPPAPDFDVARIPSVVQSRVAVARMQQHFEREQTLLERKVSTLETYQNAEFDLNEAQAAAESALLTARATLANALASQVELDVARQDKTDMEIRAPEPSRAPQGIHEPIVYAITKRSVAEGQMLREGDAVMELVIENPLRLWTTAPERFSPDIHAGQEVRVHVASHLGRNFAGRVAWVNPAIDPISRTFQVEVAVPNDERLLRPGGFAKAAIVTRDKIERTVVPVEAIVRYAGVTKVFVARDGQAVDVPVATGIEGAGWMEVTGEIQPGAQVVVSGQSQLADGTPILVRDPPKATAQAERTACKEEMMNQ